MNGHLNRADWFFITVLLLFAAGLRILGISYGQPDPRYAPSTDPVDQLHVQTPMQPDEYVSVATPVNMHLRDTLHPGFFEYPSFIFNTSYVLFGLTGAVDDITLESRAGLNLRQYAPFHLYVFSRMYSVLGGS